VTSPGDPLPLVARARVHETRLAVAGPEGLFSYADLLASSDAVARTLLGDEEDLSERRVAFLLPPGFDYVSVLWGIWRAGGLAVPLATSHPTPELEYVLDDADPSILVVHPDFADRIAPGARARGVRVLLSPDAVPRFPREGSSPLPSLSGARRAMMLYTSGTTGRPKGVVSTHGNLEAQISSLVEAWRWSRDDHILLVLPLHHVHGIVNVLCCALWSGACCQILSEFDGEETWSRIARGDLTLFMAVPTIYSKLLTSWEAAAPEVRHQRSAGCRAMRLLVSGSAALPVTLLERWREVSGHVLLERYGMTEIGMALSNPLEGTRRPGFVGRPLPSVDVRIVDEGGRQVTPGDAGEIEVRGPTVFKEYWRRPAETEQAFRGDWFMTGDVAVVEGGDVRILGRKSVDIIKTGGYKVSALEVEEVLRTHPQVAECAVVGVPDPEWGERVGAAVVARGGSIETSAVRDWAKERLAPYKAPSIVLSVDRLPRNAMGKVTKPDVQKLFLDSVR
jgi:malonyl-CoA/methylmalonyl-CoA synthetase